MANLDRYQFTIAGSTFADGTGSPDAVVVWVSGPEDSVESLGEAKSYAGLVSNDSGLLGYAWKLVLVPFGLTEGAVNGHDNARYLHLMQVLGLRYKHITSVSGPDIVGLGGGAAQYWAQLLMRFANKIPIHVKSIASRFDYEGYRWVTLDLKCRYPGVSL